MKGKLSEAERATYDEKLGSADSGLNEQDAGGQAASATHDRESGTRWQIIAAQPFARPGAGRVW